MQTSSKENKLKLRHLTGAYLHLNDSPIDEDILYFLGTQKHKASTIGVISKAFGEHKADRVEAVIRSLAVKMLITKMDSPQGQIISLA